MTRRLLWLAYYFPPAGGAGVQRSVALCRTLPAYGWQPFVVTGPANAARSRWTPADPSFELPPARRVPGPEPPSAHGTRFARVVMARSAWQRWWTSGAFDAGVTELGDGGCEAIVATMSPFESAEVASRLAAASGRPWIADLRDPWALDEMLVYPSAWHRRRELARMRKLLASAHAVIANTEAAGAAITAACPQIRHLAVVPNGFDPSDFARPPQVRTDDAFRIVHVGYLHTALGRRHRARRFALRGGAATRVDILTRSHVYLLEALAGLLDDERSRIELHLVGVYSPADEAATNASAARGCVRATGYSPHHEVADVLRSGDLLFLPMHDLPDGEEATIVPGKTYEYLASGRSILGAVPPGDARRLLLASGRATVCAPGDVAAMRAAVRAHLASARAPQGPPPLDTASLTWAARAARFAAVLDAVVVPRSRGRRLTVVA